MLPSKDIKQPKTQQIRQQQDHLQQDIDQPLLLTPAELSVELGLLEGDGDDVEQALGVERQQSPEIRIDWLVVWRPLGVQGRQAGVDIVLHLGYLLFVNYSSNNNRD